MLSKDTRVLVIMGGWSAEREVSLETGQAVAACLERGGYPVKTVDLVDERPRLAVMARLLETARDFRADVAYLALHGPSGEDGTMQGLLELAGIPYNGSGVLASALGNDKPAAKQVFVSSKITTPKYVVVTAAETPATPPLPCPVIVKPRALGSSLGVVLVERPEDFPAALAHARSFGQEAMVEQYITGRELQACVIDGEALPLIEVVSSNKLYDYEAKYTRGKSEHKVPAPVPKKQYDAAQKLAVAAYRALGCAGAARVELIAEATGTLYVIEVNTLPGMTVTSLTPEAAREAGMSFLDLVCRELEGALRRHAAQGAVTPAETASA